MILSAMPPDLSPRVSSLVKISCGNPRSIRLASSSVFNSSAESESSRLARLSRSCGGAARSVNSSAPPGLIATGHMIVSGGKYSKWAYETHGSVDVSRVMRADAVLGKFNPTTDTYPVW